MIVGLQPPGAWMAAVDEVAFAGGHCDGIGSAGPILDDVSLHHPAQLEFADAQLCLRGSLWSIQVTRSGTPSVARCGNRFLNRFGFFAWHEPASGNPSPPLFKAKQIDRIVIVEGGDFPSVGTRKVSPLTVPDIDVVANAEMLFQFVCVVVAIMAINDVDGESRSRH